MVLQHIGPNLWFYFLLNIQYLYLAQRVSFCERNEYGM